MSERKGLVVYIIWDSGDKLLIVMASILVCCFYLVPLASVSQHFVEWSWVVTELVFWVYQNFVDCYYNDICKLKINALSFVCLQKKG